MSDAAHAQALHTRAPGGGDDVNPRSRAARVSVSDPAISNSAVTAVGMMSNEFGRH